MQAWARGQEACTSGKELRGGGGSGPLSPRCTHRGERVRVRGDAKLVHGGCWRTDLRLEKTLTLALSQFGEYANLGEGTGESVERLAMG